MRAGIAGLLGLVGPTATSICSCGPMKASLPTSGSCRGAPVEVCEQEIAAGFVELLLLQDNPVWPASYACSLLDMA